MDANQPSGQPIPCEGYIQVENAQLYYRDIGQGQPIFILHGGPSFDHHYLLPDMDRLAGSFRLIYYDQRGRGRSAENVQPEQVSLQSEIEDLERLREYFQLDTVAVLGHSWGGLLAMEYAIRYPQRVSHLILMNSSPPSRDDHELFQQERRRTAARDVEKLQALASTAEYQAGDLEKDAEFNRINFNVCIRQPEHLDRVMENLRLGSTPESIRRARAIANRLYEDTWRLSEYDLFPKLAQLAIPTLVIHGDYDFIPEVCAAHIAEAVPGARLVMLKDCGHFAYLERPDEVHREMAAFFEHYGS